ncbi:SGNH/GDSL hydrolase family protein [Gilvimarinus xylanilyticus]|uniref:GDSL-type esterase/lipase family protein n=1 Tax=Gilvimarinus xylanilyticus TaxID=2944139 RepID=A0A9X2I1Q2_9GAMM|nr:SGNH/GDSL hydrolase family protein [Gilvimarinus xylanilyticus]MCP8897922.1 GDSL-type esterase/lipase family protein [Gilvimarinus xylanilyticus]
MAAQHVFALLLVGLLSACAQAPKTTTLNADDPAVRWSGRHAAQDGEVRFGYPSVSANVRISGGTLTMTAVSNKGESWMSVRVDDQPPKRFQVSAEPRVYPLVENSTQAHTVRVSHVGETWRGIVTVEGFNLIGGEFRAPPAPPQRKLLVIGDSVTCGEGVYTPPAHHCDSNPRQPDSDNSYGMRLGKALNAETQLVCYGGRGLIRSWNGNTDDLQAPQFFDLSIPEPGQPQADLQAFVPKIILISLGTNDFSLGIGPLPEKEAFVSAYVDFTQRLLSLYPEAKIALTEGSIVNDDDPERPQKTVLRDYIAHTIARVDSPRLFQVDSPYYPGDQCDAHPTGAQHKAMADALERQLTPQI